jgi:phosphoribosylamine---glycine ligase
VRILVVGGGGREHALCWRLSQNPSVDRLFAAPGNAGIAEVATLLAMPADDVNSIAEFVERESIDLTVVGPEAPLVAGLADELEARGLPVFGPTREGARLEGSKSWARSLCDRHGIPAPRSGAFDEVKDAVNYLDDLDPPYVVKADGLAGGKGVVIAENRRDAVAAVEASLIDRSFGDAGLKVVVEEYLEGREVSAFAITDGRHALPLALARDYKRALDGDRGPNTGGMGAYSPVQFVDEKTEAGIVEGVLDAAVRALQDEGIRYRGVIYAGLMLTADGPKVLEFNARFGDPEAQVILPRLQANLTDVLLACLEGNLAHYELSWTPEACVGVVLASGGYPGVVEAGKVISGLDAASALADVQVFHSGTVARDDRVVTAGGRVLTVTALGAGAQEARERAYEACSLIGFDGMSYRRDIAAAAGQGTG